MADRIENTAVRREIGKLWHDLKEKEKDLGSIKVGHPIWQKIKEEISVIQKRIDKVKKDNNIPHDKK